MRIGIDLGGSKIEAISLDEGGQELARIRINTPAGNYDETIAAISTLIDRIEQDSGSPESSTIGIGIPGAISPVTGVVKNANSVCLIGRPLQQDLEEALSRPVRIANDANCFAMSEAIDGAGAGANLVFGVILGTGVGGGLVINGKVYEGLNAIAGEWGHNPLPWAQDGERPGPDCYCGKRGCIETYLSGPGLARDTRSESGTASSGEEVATRAECGDGEAIAALGRYQERLARSLASVINILDPDVIVLGGGLSNIRQLYDAVPRIWKNWVFSDEVRTRLVKNIHGDSSGVRGAAWLWPSSA
ncbi:MAG: ROK family protein [Rhodospirillales bacterium]|nr:ROK family protein [Rhodospirillales bacterium]